MLASKQVITRLRGIAGKAKSIGIKATTVRSFAIHRSMEKYYNWDEPRNPNYTIDSIEPPESFNAAVTHEEKKSPLALERKTMTSASAIDMTSDPPKLSVGDTVTITANGVKHGRYGEFSKDEVKDIPVEYLTMLHPAAQAAAALRTLGASDGGTVLVYGASQPAGIAATQMAANLHNAAVVAVVDGQHSGEDELVDAVKGMAKYPGTAVGEPYATLKANFRDLVNDTVSGTGGASAYSVDSDFLVDFKQNLLDYCAMYPEGKAAVDPDDYQFYGKEGDRKHFKDNMEAYLEQFSSGAPPIGEGELEAAWTKEQYAAFKAKFDVQAVELLTPGVEMQDPDFEPPRIVKNMLGAPETPNEYTLSKKPEEGSDYFPYEFNVLQQDGSDVMGSVANPMLGAIIVATPNLVKVAEAVSKAKTVRGKAEALAFFSKHERDAFYAATHVAGLATAAGRGVVVVGGMWIVLLCFLLLAIYSCNAF
jgi:hypothetical protein